jgi:hypothetical protein
MDICIRILNLRTKKIDYLTKTKDDLYCAEYANRKTYVDMNYLFKMQMLGMIEILDENDYDI